MINRSQFRAIVLISFFAYAYWFFYPVLFLHSADETIMRLMRFSGYAAKIPDSPIVYWSYFVLWSLITVGLLFFQNWARRLFIGFLLFSILSSPFYGVAIDLPLSILAISIVSTLDGVILVLILSPQLLRNEFK